MNQPHDYCAPSPDTGLPRREDSRGFDTHARASAANDARARTPAARATDGIVGASAALTGVASMVARVANSAATVLITGPSGCGKEHVARTLHAAGRFRDEPFIVPDGAVLPEDARGTLFLDEVGDLTISQQVQLLRLLQEREQTTAPTARVVAATRADLRAAVRAGKFREDLFYRLAVIELVIPPLCDRAEDVMPLAEHFLRRAAARAGRGARGFTPAAARRMVAHDWPGNARELANVVERAVALMRDEWVAPEDLPDAVRFSANTGGVVATGDALPSLAEVQMRYVRHVLARLGGNKKRAAAVLGVSRRSLQRWLGGEGDAEGGDGAAPDGKPAT